jgi:GWxTD domain-containing protein
MKTAGWVVFAVALAAVTAVVGCRLYHLEKRLTPAYADFYAKVQYIMTSGERKIFLELPDSEKDRFIADFWERRNPNPGSGANAFKTEYEDRLRRADILFLGEGRPGFLTDRGRIYVLFGPPSERLTFPMEAAGHCREIWYYGAFPVIFEDEDCIGRYLLTAINLDHLQALNMALGHFQQTFSSESRFFDYSVSLRQVRDRGADVEATIVIDVPYGGIWFTSRDDHLDTALDVRLEGRDPSGARVWGIRRTFPLSLSESELEELAGKSYLIEIPLVLAKDSEAARSGKIVLDASVKNRTEDEPLKKVLVFRLKT